MGCITFCVSSIRLRLPDRKPLQPQFFPFCVVKDFHERFIDIVTGTPDCLFFQQPISCKQFKIFPCCPITRSQEANLGIGEKEQVVDEILAIEFGILVSDLVFVGIHGLLYLFNHVATRQGHSLDSLKYEKNPVFPVVFISHSLQ
jgi:hypothetical protein